MDEPSSISFVLSNDDGLTFELSNDDGLTFELTAPISMEADVYTGDTMVDPDYNGRTLNTARKLVTEDITVKPIRVERISNLSGGVTVYIGS